MSLLLRLNHTVTEKQCIVFRNLTATCEIIACWRRL